MTVAVGFPPVMPTFAGQLSEEDLQALVMYVKSLSVPVDRLRRISVGGGLALAAWTGFSRAAQVLRSEGSFAGLASLVPYAEINGLFSADFPGTA